MPNSTPKVGKRGTACIPHFSSKSANQVQLCSCAGRSPGILNYFALLKLDPMFIFVSSMTQEAIFLTGCSPPKDTAYLSGELELEPAIRTNYKRGLFPPYAVVEAKASSDFMPGAVNYSAWVVSSLLHERLRFRSIFCENEIDYDETDSIYTVCPAGEDVHIYKMLVRSPNAHERRASKDNQGHHIRCELKLLERFSLTKHKDCLMLFNWMNHIHYYRMTRHRDGKVNEAIFRYGKDGNSCTISWICIEH